jgi:hypothetical protein
MPREKRSIIIRTFNLKMQLNIPLGSAIDKEEENAKTVRIRIPNTKFWILGEKISRSNWRMSLIDSQSDYRDIIHENITTKSFVIFSNVILKTPFPYKGKRAGNSSSIKRFLNKIYKNICPIQKS